MQRGKFIVIDGGDGAGKDTQIASLQKSLANFPIVWTRDPGGTAASEAIRGLLLGKEKGFIAPRAEFLLFLASRSQLVEEVIMPALSSGKHIICNRFDLSTIAYQVYGRKREQYLETFREISAFANDSIVPDLYVLLDLPPEIGLARKVQMKGENIDRFEREKIDFHTRVVGAFKKHITDYPNHVVINANREKEEVSTELEKILKTLLLQP